MNNFYWIGSLTSDIESIYKLIFSIELTPYSWDSCDTRKLGRTDVHSGQCSFPNPRSKWGGRQRDAGKMWIQNIGMVDMSERINTLFCDRDKNLKKWKTRKNKNIQTLREKPKFRRNNHLTELTWPNECDRKICAWPKRSHQRTWAMEVDRKSTTTTNMKGWIWPNQKNQNHIIKTTNL